MDSIASIQISRFEYPMIPTDIMALWHDEFEQIIICYRFIILHFTRQSFPIIILIRLSFGLNLFIWLQCMKTLVKRIQIRIIIPIAQRWHIYNEGYRRIIMYIFKILSHLRFHILKQLIFVAYLRVSFEVVKELDMAIRTHCPEFGLQLDIAVISFVCHGVPFEV